MHLDWRVKALVQTGLSVVPGGAHVNYALQRATGGLPLSTAKLADVSAIAGRHIEAVRRHGPVAPADAWFFEFGAGWDLHVPLSLFALGAGRQTVVDLRRLARPDLVADVARRLAQHPPAGAVRAPLPAQGRALDDHLAAMGIRYVAPADARRTGLADGCIDVITSTNTLEHIPPADIAAILTECHRILGPDGIMSFQIDYQDHYSYFDGTIGPYHFLRYPPQRWRWFNGDLHHQNRLRHDDHLRLLAEAGFQVVHEELEGPDADDLAALATQPLDDAYLDVPLERLGIRRSLLVLRKAP